MPNSENEESTDGLSLADLVAPVVAARHMIWRVTALAILAAALISGAYFLWQPSIFTASIGFRPTFKGAEDGEYPNTLRFAVSDVTDPSIVDEVFEKNEAKQFCAREAFRSALTVEQTSMALQMLELEYTARLADARISPIERQRLQDEFGARRQTVTPQYRVLFVRPIGCERLPAPVVYKMLSDILQTWADSSETRRGVLMLRRSVLSPAIFDGSFRDNQTLLVRADVVRSALLRVIANITEVEKLPGAELVRLPGEGTSLAEVKAKLEELLQTQLDPLVAMAGRNLGLGSIAWVEQSLEVAGIQHKVALERAKALGDALREYSGLSTNPLPGAPAQKSQNPVDVQALTPQIEETFIDRIVGMSEKNTLFRQDLTKQLVTAMFIAVDLGEAVAHYRHVLESLRSPSGMSLPVPEVTERLSAISTAGKDLTRRFNAIYEEFSRVSLRAAPAMYRIEQPVSSITLRAFGRRDFTVNVLSVLIVTPIVLALGVLVHDRWRRFTLARPSPSR